LVKTHCALNNYPSVERNQALRSELQLLQMQRPRRREGCRQSTKDPRRGVVELVIGLEGRISGTYLHVRFILMSLQPVGWLVHERTVGTDAYWCSLGRQCWRGGSLMHVCLFSIVFLPN
jgi:hypothetical protein